MRSLPKLINAPFVLTSFTFLPGFSGSVALEIKLNVKAKWEFIWQKGRKVFQTFTHTHTILYILYILLSRLLFSSNKKLLGTV